jgi:ethanolamine ammonia-lyase small subunit
MAGPNPVTSLSPVTPSRWEALRQLTDARLALGRAGHSLPTTAHLAFQLAHAQARDAVHLPLDALGLATDLSALKLESLQLQSAAADRLSYLQRPDLGRKLDTPSRQVLARWMDKHRQPVFDLAFVIADGLSALAVHQNAVALISATWSRLQTDTAHSWALSPIVIALQARVAIGDEVGEALHAKTVVVLIGERPGLSSPDSLGAYLTWAPRAGLTDVSRNCISNIRPAGLPIAAAAVKLHHLLSQARTRQLSGVALKDETDASALASASPAGGNFLLRQS